MMLILVDKPQGITSFDVIRILKKEFPGEKIGHSGTLDPMATGVMILGVGKGTKQLEGLIGLDKSYETLIDFSKESDTWDTEFWDYFLQYEKNADGNFIRDGQSLNIPSLEAIEGKLSFLIWDGVSDGVELPLPPFSAKKKEGKRLYQMARRGKQDLEYRTMKIYEAQVLRYEFPELELFFSVGKGTYIRSLGYRLGKEFELGGILTSLRRTRVGLWNLKDVDLIHETKGIIRGKEYDVKWTVIEE